MHARLISALATTRYFATSHQSLIAVWVVNYGISNTIVFTTRQWFDVVLSCFPVSGTWNRLLSYNNRTLVYEIIIKIFFENFECFFFSRSNSWMVGPIDVKRKGGASVECWVNYVTSTFDLTHDLDLRFFKVKFQNSCISGIVIWFDVKQKGSKSVRYWADCMALPFDHNHDHDLVVWWSKFEIALFEEWEGWLTWNERDVSRSFTTLTLTYG